MSLVQMASEIDVKVNAASLSAGTISGDKRRDAPIASTFHGASVASTLWLKRRLRTGWLIFPFSIAWKRRPGCRLAVLQSRRCNWRTLSADSRPPGWLEPVVPVMPSRVLARPTLPPQGPFAPRALFVARLLTTTVPSDSRCAAVDFTVGLYEARWPDPTCADGSLVFRSAPCPRAALRTPPSSPARTSPDWGARDIVFAAK